MKEIQQLAVQHARWIQTKPSDTYHLHGTAILDRSVMLSDSNYHFLMSDTYIAQRNAKCYDIAGKLLSTC